MDKYYTVTGQFVYSLYKWCNKVWLKWPIIHNIFTKPKDCEFRKVLTVESVTVAIKARVDAIYINPKIFYFYLGNEIKDVRSKVMWRGNDDDRNNFAPISNIMSTTCDHDAFCLGSLGANYLKGGNTPRLEEVRRCVHTSHDH